MSRVALRYYAQENEYFVEIKSPEYFAIDKQIRRTAREYDSISNTDSDQKPFLKEKRQRLRLQRDAELRYIWIRKEDIPENMSARPIYKRPRTVEELPDRAYREMIAALQGANDS